MSRAKDTPLMPWPLPEWNRTSALLKPFAYADAVPHTTDQINALAADAKLTPDQLREFIRQEAAWPILMNDIYQVSVRWTEGDPGNVQVVHLSLKRRDKAAFDDWRHKQEIKNMLVGPEYEGLELYPAESRLVDTANQYHLWVLREEGYRLPFGFHERAVLYENDPASGAVQRPRAKGPTA